MSYAYRTEKPKVFSEKGQEMFLAIRDNACRLLKSSGAAMMGHIISGRTGDSWTMLACVDRLVELGELRELDYGQCQGQDRVFVNAKL